MKIAEIKLGQIKPSLPERQQSLGSPAASLAERLREDGLRAYLLAHPITVHQIDEQHYRLIGGIDSFRFSRQVVGDNCPLPVQVIPPSHRRLANQVEWCDLLIHSSVGCGIPTDRDRIRLWLEAWETASHSMAELGLSPRSQQDLADLLGISVNSLRARLPRSES